MDRITTSTSDCKNETTSAWLASVLQFGLDTGFFAPLKAFSLKMKEVKYSVYQKLLTIIASVIMGCEYTKDINEVLGPEKLAANLLGMEHFPDQSQINTLLTRTDDENIKQLENIHNELFSKYSLSTASNNDVVIDIDMSGLIAGGKTYEFSDKGYFPRKRGKTGYQISAAFAGEYSEAIALYLDTGNTHCQNRLKDLVEAVLVKYPDQIRQGKLIIRADSGYGALKNIAYLASLKGLKFVVKGYSTTQAAKIAETVPFACYTKVDEATWVVELPPLKNGVRRILVQILDTKGELIYTILYTNIGREKLSSVEAFHFYNGRQTIEAFFKMAKNTYGIKNLRTRKFYGIYTFLWMVFMTHNLITWFKAIKLSCTKLKDVGVKTLVKKCSRIKGFVERTIECIKVIIPPLSKLAQLLIEALLQPNYIQLSFLD
ncbi:MAG: transposase [Firmicutes bacterium]|nr:transposase [Bacillota bacterium]NSW92119.1 transposase [Bacillota bacterium]